MKRVKSFPIIPDEEDVAAVVDQSSKAAKKAAKKVAQQMVSGGAAFHNIPCHNACHVGVAMANRAPSAWQTP